MLDEVMCKAFGVHFFGPPCITDYSKMLLIYVIARKLDGCM